MVSNLILLLTSLLGNLAKKAPQSLSQESSPKEGSEEKETLTKTKGKSRANYFQIGDFFGADEILPIFHSRQKHFLGDQLSAAKSALFNL